MQKIVLSFLFCFLTSCVYLSFDTSKAASLQLVSRSATPAFEEVRSFIQYNDLVYVAAGSGGLLVYRIVGEQMQPVPFLSLTNLYADGLDPVFVRTVEIIEGKLATNLIFSFDTVGGGGIGAAEISSAYTKPLGGLTANQGMRIRRTDTRVDPDGGFLIIAANEYLGVLTYKLSIISNNLFDQQNVASLAAYVTAQGLGGALTPFTRLQAPGENIRNTITNIDTLLELVKKDPTRALEIVKDVPFISPEQRKTIEKTVSSLGVSNIGNLLNDPSVQSFLDSGLVDKILPEANVNLDGILSSLGQAPLSVSNDSNAADELPTVEAVPMKDLASDIVLAQGGMPALPPPSAAEESVSPSKESFYLSNVAAMTNFTVDPDKVNTPDFNPFIVNRPILNAKKEIDITAFALGRQTASDDQGVLKERLQGLTAGEQNAVFDTLFNQADLLTKLVPLLETSGFSPRQLYQFWQEGRIDEIIQSLDTALLADMINLLPQTKIETKLTVQSTNALLPSVRNMSSDGGRLYLSLGREGFAVVDRATDKILKTVQKEFSEVESVVPFSAYGKNYLAVADRLDGLVIYERHNNGAPGKQITKLNLLGEGKSIFVQDTLIWLADGSNSVLAIRFNKDKTLSVEAEFFDKSGVARYIGAARPREVLVSYGADGFARLRLTNIGESNVTALQQAEIEEKTLAQRTIEWNNTSSLFRFLRRLFL